MLELVNIRKRFGETEAHPWILKGISVRFRKNEFVSILGPSGCGKTTMLNIIGGLDKYTDGNLLIDGVSRGDRHPACDRCFEERHRPCLTIGNDH